MSPLEIDDRGRRLRCGVDCVGGHDTGRSTDPDAHRFGDQKFKARRAGIVVNRRRIARVLVTAIVIVRFALVERSGRRCRQHRHGMPVGCAVDHRCRRDSQQQGDHQQNTQPACAPAEGCRPERWNEGCHGGYPGELLLRIDSQYATPFRFGPQALFPARSRAESRWLPGK